MWSMKILRFFLILISLLLIMFFVSYLSINKNVFWHDTSLADSFSVFYQSPTPTASPLNKNLSEAVANAIKDGVGTYAIYIKNLKNGEEFSLNEKMPFVSASLYKLWILGEAYKEIESGTLSKEEILDSGFLTVENALNSMITISDNNSSALLIKRMGYANIINYLKVNGLLGSVIFNNNQSLTTASDIGLFFEKLYKNQLASETSSKEMINILKSQKLNSMLPQFLPKEVPIAHKTGNLDGFVHDAGLVYSPNSDYIIVVLSQGEDPKNVDKVVASISKAVYDYFN